MDFYKINLFLFLCFWRPAKCDERCPKTLVLKYGHVRLQSRGGVTAIFTCNPGYTLRGSNVSHCQTDGHWSAPIPLCEPQGQECTTLDIESIILHSGQSVNITCFFNEAGSTRNLFWTRNGNRIDNTHLLNNSLILSANKEGTYLCLFFNETSAGILKATKIILSHESSVNNCELFFKDNVTSVTNSIGSELILSCEVNLPTARVTWFKNDEHLSHSRTHLNITHLEEEDEGNYTCVAEEARCRTSKSIIVRVQNPFSCGQPVGVRYKRVIDGSRAAPFSAPWMCMLSLDREPPFCGCSLISSSWVITAAHCFKMQEIRNKIRVKFGKQQRRQIERGEIVRGVEKIISHPDYKPDSSNRNITSEHDIALVKLDAPVVFQLNILPICLPPPGFTDSVPIGTLGMVTGWGRVSVRDSVMALTLQKAYLPLVNNSSCQASTGYLITENMLCAGYAESYRPDTCFGDSGGPFILKKHNTWFLAGIVSWGEGCSTPMKYGIYTKVENYVPWIRSLWN